MTDWLAHITPLTEDDAPAMYALMQDMFIHLPDQRWYYGSTQEELAEQARLGNAVGIWQEGRLVAMNILVPAAIAHDGGYAAILGLDDPDSLNFEDVVVVHDYQRQGIHSAFLHRASTLGYKTIYATVDPDNLPSLRSFEKAGYQRIAQKIVYDGRPRVFVRLCL
ncbi:MAG: GNAT family N-acetyltransferase [Clostridia bacterium]|nr:GNAT family N-acetyltransferase [Clostridia bacterium]